MIRSLLLAFLLMQFAACSTRNAEERSPFKDGDVIFQSLKSNQSDAIQIATSSKYSHCGIIFWQGNQCFVFEAFRKVKATPLDEFIQRSKGGHYAIRRLKEGKSVFSTEEDAKNFVKIYYRMFDGKPYDVLYGASDEKIYCSELVWKLYKTAANLDVGKWKKLRDFDLSSRVVQEELTYTYGDHIPYDEQIISPEALYTSGEFVTVEEK